MRKEQVNFYPGQIIPIDDLCGISMLQCGSSMTATEARLKAAEAQRRQLMACETSTYPMFVATSSNSASDTLSTGLTVSTTDTDNTISITDRSYITTIAQPIQWGGVFGQAVAPQQQQFTPRDDYSLRTKKKKFNNYRAELQDEMDTWLKGVLS